MHILHAACQIPTLNKACVKHIMCTFKDGVERLSLVVYNGVTSLGVR